MGDLGYASPGRTPDVVLRLALAHGDGSLCLMPQGTLPPAGKVVIEYQNKRPIDLLDLTSSLAAVGEQYRRYMVRETGEKAGARLHVGQLRSGSIIAELIPLLEGFEWLHHHSDFVGGFVTNFGDILSTLRAFPPRAREIDKSDVRAAKTFMGPIAKDVGAQVNIHAEAGSTIITNNFNFGHNGAKDIRRHADIVLAGMPDEASFDAEPMVLHQMRDGPAGLAGDAGFIDRFSGSAVKLRWASEEVKAAVLDRSENVFDLIYFVSGVAQTAGGRIAAYKIHRLDDVAMKPAEERHG